MNKICRLLTGLSLLLTLVGCQPAPKEGAVNPSTPGGTNQPGGGGNPAGGPGGGLAGRNGGPGSGNRQPQTVLSIPAVKGELKVDRETAGTVQSVLQSSVSPQISGVVAKVWHRTGDRVAAGEPIFQIDDAQLNLSLRTAKTGLENAQLNLKISSNTNTLNNPKLKLQVQTAQASLEAALRSRDTTKKLIEIGGASANDLANADIQVQNAQAALQTAQLSLGQSDDADNQSLAQLKMAVQSAQVQVDQASLNLANALVRAPFEGLLSSVAVNPGQFVSTSQVAYVLLSPQKQIQFSVTPGDAAAFAPGRPATFDLNGTTTPLVISSWPSAPVNGLVSLTAEAKGPLTAGFGQVGTVRYEVHIASGFLVPVTALSSNADGAYVWRIEDGKAKRTPVTVTGEAGVRVSVDGLAAGQILIDSPPPGLVEGAAVKTADAQPAGTNPGGKGQGAGAAPRDPANGKPTGQAGRPADASGSPPTGPAGRPNRPQSADGSAAGSPAPTGSAAPGAEGRSNRPAGADWKNRPRPAGSAPAEGQ